MNRILANVLIVVLLTGCASITPESVMTDHKAKRVERLDGTLDENYRFAKKLLKPCYPMISFSMVMGAPSALEFHEITGNGEKSILLGNVSQGGMGYFRFYESGNNTELEAYSNGWYDSGTRAFQKYVNGLVQKDLKACD